MSKWSCHQIHVLHRHLVPKEESWTLSHLTQQNKNIFLLTNLSWSHQNYAKSPSVSCEACTMVSVIYCLCIVSVIDHYILKHNQNISKLDWLLQPRNSIWQSLHNIGCGYCYVFNSTIFWTPRAKTVRWPMASQLCTSVLAMWHGQVWPFRHSNGCQCYATAKAFQWLNWTGILSLHMACLLSTQRWW